MATSIIKHEVLNSVRTCFFFLGSLSFSVHAQHNVIESVTTINLYRGTMPWPDWRRAVFLFISSLPTCARCMCWFRNLIKFELVILILEKVRQIRGRFMQRCWTTSNFVALLDFHISPFSPTLPKKKHCHWTGRRNKLGLKLYAGMQY